MKLAQALAERADAQRRLAQLRQRVATSARELDARIQAKNWEIDLVEV